MSILFTIIILGLIIFLHELGHFMAAKYYKMPVLEFAIGMGPKLISKRVGETFYSIRVLPLGGFVNIGGMQPEDNVPDGFYTKSPFSRFVVLIAGVMMNFITAVIGIMILFSITGSIPAKYTPPVVGVIQEDSNAEGILMTGDKIIEIDGKRINNWGDVSREILSINSREENYNGEEILIKVIRKEKEESQRVRLTYNQERNGYFLGIQVAESKVSFLKKLEISFYSFGDYFRMMIDGVRKLVTGNVSVKEMTGPVGLPKFVGEAYRIGGGFALLNIFVLLSINIGIMNLLPIPALDGGRLLFVIPEFFGIKINKKIEEKIHLIGMIFLLILMVFIIFNDVTKYF